MSSAGEKMPMVRHIHLWVVLALVLALGLGLAASPSPAAAQEQPRRGGTLVVGLINDPQMLNGSLTTDLASSTVATQVYSTLIRIDGELNVYPELAEKWDIGKDGLTYTFYLRKNVKWHDGKPFTSADVKFGMMEILRKYKGTASLPLSMVESVDTPDPYTVVFKLKDPYPPFFPWTVGMPAQSMILPKHLYEGSDPMKNEYNLKPIGTGPFVFKEWVRGSHIALERNPDYFKSGQPYLDRLVFKIVPDTAARVVALEKGEIDHLNYFSLPATAIKPLAGNPNLEVVVDRNRAAYAVISAFLNLRHPQLQKKEVRQAIAHAIDRKALVEKAIDGAGDPGSSPVSSHMKKFYNPGVPKYEFDPARASQLLDQAGLPRKADGNRLSLRFSFTRGGEGGALDSAGSMIREQLRAVGIDLELQPMDSATWGETAFVKWDFDMTITPIQTGPDPAVGVAASYTTDNIRRVNGGNLTGYSNPRVDELFKLGAREVDEAKRVATYREIQNLIVGDSPAVWLWDKFSPVAQRKTVKGGLPAGVSHYENFDRIWLATAGGGGGAAPTPWIAAGLVVVAIAVGGILAVRWRRSA